MAGHPVQLEALYDIWRTSRHVPSAVGAAVVDHYGKGAEQFFLATLRRAILVYAPSPVVDRRPDRRVQTSFPGENKQSSASSGVRRHCSIISKFRCNISHRVVGKRQGRPARMREENVRVFMSFHLIWQDVETRHWITSPYYSW